MPKPFLQDRRRLRTTSGIAVALFFAWNSSAARAHFLFIRIGEAAEAGRKVEVFFSERAAAGDPRFIAKTAPTTLSQQSAPGKFVPLAVRKGSDRLNATLPAGGPVSVSGFLEYGVLKREVPFLLRYYPKAIAGNPKELSRFQRRSDLSLEINANIDGDRVELSLLRDGKPVSGTLFTTVDDDLVNEEIKADDKGLAVWKPPSPGYYCIYAKSVLKTPGERDGKPFAEIREFATISFRWPLDRHDPDPQAVALFQKALASRATWQSFAGFTADVGCSVDGRQSDGKVSVSASGDIDLKLDDAATKKWVEGQIHSLVMHRLPPGASESQPPVLRFGDADVSHPLGRLLVYDGGEFASSYRVADDKIKVVNRTFGDQNMSIVVLDEETNAEGKQLPRSYTVQYWDAKNGQLDRTESVSNRWKRVGSLDLPASVTVAVSSKVGLSVRSIMFTNQTLMKPGKR